MHKLFANHKRIFLVVLVFAVLLAGVTAGWWFLVRDSSTKSETKSTYTPYVSEETDIAVNESAKLTSVGDTKGAIAVLDEYLASGRGSNREKAFIYSNKGSILLLFTTNPEQVATSREEAIKAYQAAIDLAPDDPMYYASLGKAHEYSGRVEESKQYYQQALGVYDAGLPDSYRGQDRDYFVKLVDHGINTSSLAGEQ